jgi:O-antigen/teichoic acid export membrane protein
VSSDATRDGAEEPTPSLAEAAVSGVRWISAARAFSEVVGLGAMVVLARLIPPAEFGIFVIALIVQELALSILGESVGNAIVQRPEIRRAHLQVAQVIALAVGLMLMLLTVCAAPLVVAPLFGSETATLVLASTPMFLIVAFGTVPIAMLQRRLAFKTIGIIQIAGLFVRCAGSVALALFAGMDAEALVIAGLAAGVTGTAIAIASVRLPRPGLDATAARELADFGVPAGFAAISWIGFRNADYTIVGARLGLASTGIYWRAFQLAVEYQKKISTILYQIAFPLLSRTASTDELLALRLRMVRLLTITVFPLLAALAVFAPTLIPWLFGESWRAAVLPAQILTVAGAATLVIDTVGTTLMAAGRPRALLVYGWSHFIAYAGVIVLIAPRGVVAVSVAAAAVHFVFLFAAYGLLLRDYVERPLLQLWHDIAPASISTGAAAGVAIAATWALAEAHAPAFAGIVVGSLVAAPVYLLVLRASSPAGWRDLTVLARRVIPQRVLRRRPPEPALAGATSR